MNPMAFAAQADVATSGLSELLKFGVLGIFSVLLIVALVWVVKSWKASMEARITDAQAFANGLKEVNDAGARLTIETNKTQTEAKSALDGLVKSHDDLKTSNTAEHASVRGAVDALREKQAEFIAVAKATHKDG